MNPIFNPNFLNTDKQIIADAIKSDGYFFIENALAESWLQSIERDVATHPFAINHNWVTGVYAEAQYFLTHMLACSKVFFDYVTHSKIFDVCDHMLGTQFRLKAIRYYETYGNHHMQWHTDNKTDRGFAHIPGLIFIAYVSDVSDGEFQYIKGSHNWSGDKAYSDYSDEFINKNHGKEIVSFKAPRGSLLIYDTYGIHRAKPVFSKNFVRKSLFFQVDSKIDSAEPLLINPAFFSAQEKINEKLAVYLGFGSASEYQVFPTTSLYSLPAKRLDILKITGWIFHRVLRGIYNSAPLSLKNTLRRVLGKNTL